MSSQTHSSLEKYFKKFRDQIIGNDQHFKSVNGDHRIIYADWTASGRLYRPIEEKLINEFGPFVGNTHTETSVTGTAMTLAYHKAREIIKEHVHADKNDCIISFGSGMTGVVNKFQRILGLRLPEQVAGQIKFTDDERPVVFVTHMEHHSNQTSWLETIADVELIAPTKDGLVDVGSLKSLLEKYKNRKIKYASVTACSNVTGIKSPYFEIAELMHKSNGYCFVDFACSAPYMDIDMHPENPLQRLDAIFLSPHKFLGGPGTAGIIVFNSALYKIKVPDQPGGGTVKWTNPWKGRSYIDDIEDREDGGTPPFLQTIKTALCVKLKEEMGVENMMKREEEMLHKLLPAFKSIKNLHVLAGNIEDRLGVISFHINDLHYNLGVRLLNDRFGIQSRGGCSCAGTYGHYLLHLSHHRSEMFTSKAETGDLSARPGWIRLSIHPTMSDEEVNFIIEAVKSLASDFPEWSKEYTYDLHTNEFSPHIPDNSVKDTVNKWFEGIK